MVGSIASSPAVDLSGVPAPALVPQPDFETRLAAKIARLIAQMPAFSALVESDPAILLLEADSYDELVLAQAFNDTAKGLLLAYATDANLDQLGVLMDVPRLVVTPATATAAAVMELDSAYRQRIQLAPHSFSVAGPELAYVFHARSAHGDVADATAVSPTPGVVVVTVLAKSGNGVPSEVVLQAVRDRLADVRPLTDQVIVQAVELVDYAIAAQLFVYSGPDATLIENTADDSLAAFLAASRKIGRDVARSAHIAALHVSNVQRVALPSPAADIAISMSQIANPVSVEITIAGTEW
jgi:phage-related baseplate assembly protein